MNVKITEDMKDELLSLLYAVVLKEPVEAFDGFILSNTKYGYVIDDLFFCRPNSGLVYPLIFKDTLIDRLDNSAHLTYKLENVNIDKKVPFKADLIPCYYNGRNGKVFSYFEIVGEIYD